MKAEIIAVRISEIGNVHQTKFITLSDNVNKYAIGNTNITNLNNEIIRGLPAYLRACKIPWTAIENPINTNPILEILSAVEQTSIIWVVDPPDNPNNFDNGLAKISNNAVIIKVTIAVSIIPYLIQSSALFLSFIP